MGTHTPAPWLVDGHTVYALTQSPTGKANRFFCFVQSARQPFEAQGGELAANARLISAAPDLLEALRKLSAKGKAFRNTVVETRGVIGMDEHDIAIAAADVAIAKATGAES